MLPSQPARRPAASSSRLLACLSLALTLCRCLSCGFSLPCHTGPRRLPTRGQQLHAVQSGPGPLMASVVWPSSVRRLAGIFVPYHDGVIFRTLFWFEELQRNSKMSLETRRLHQEAIDARMRCKQSRDDLTLPAHPSYLSYTLQTRLAFIQDPPFRTTACPEAHGTNIGIRTQGWHRNALPYHEPWIWKQYRGDGDAVEFLQDAPTGTHRRHCH